MISFGQLLLAVSIPSIIAIIGILLNNSNMNSLRTELRADMADLRNFMNHFVDRHITHEGRIATVEERTKPKEGK
jgi:signal transduction histidine kinase